MENKQDDKTRLGAIRSIDRQQVWRLLFRSLPIQFPQFYEFYNVLRDIQKSRNDLEKKVSNASEALTEASKLVNELQTEISARVEKVGRLKEEYKRYQELAQVEEANAAALIKQLDASLGRGRGRERWVALIINLLAGLVIFILGIVLGPWLRKLLGVSQ